MNHVSLLGRLTKDADIRYTNQQTPVARFTLAVRRNGEQSDFVNCTAWSNTAELISKYVKKGDRLLVNGRIQTGSYEQNGKRYYTTEVIAENIEFIETRRSEAPTGFTPSNEGLPFR